MKEEHSFLDIYENGLLESDFRQNERLANLSLRLLDRDITLNPEGTLNNKISSLMRTK